MVRYVLIEITPGESTKQILPVGNTAGDLSRECVRNSVAGLGREEVVDDPGHVRTRIIAEHLYRDWIEAIGWNDIAGKRLALSGGVNGGRIVNGDGGFREIAGLHFCGWHAEGGAARVHFAHAFIIQEEESVRARGRQRPSQ